jgi:undecaprenyl-diphosphatase
MTEILQLDEQLFHLINHDWHVSWLDSIMPIWRDKKTWIPLYLFLAIFAVVRFKLKGVWWILALILTVGVADATSSHLIKKNVKRLRPCNDPDMKEEVELLAGCGKGYSFTSSHAANHFAMATFIALTLGLMYSWLRWPFWLWAGSIAYGQVYVGVHYPLDVLAGSLLGLLIGYFLALLYRKQTKWSIIQSAEVHA